MAQNGRAKSLQRRRWYLVIGAVVFSFTEDQDGWQLDRQAGAYAYTRLSLMRRGDALWLRGVLDATMDPLAPGMRERLAFDLRADLVALG